MMIKEDGSKCKNNEENAEVFYRHFEKLYNRTPTFDPTVIELLDQHPSVAFNDSIPDDNEILKAIKRLKNNAPGYSGLTSQMFKSIVGYEQSFEYIKDIVIYIWNSEECPSEWDTGLLRILPKKGDLRYPGNYRGIMLLETAYKII